MAYITAIVGKCEASGCMKRATHQVFNRYNATIGKFCKPCAKRALARQTKLEAGAPAPS